LAFTITNGQKGEYFFPKVAGTFEGAPWKRKHLSKKGRHKSTKKQDEISKTNLRGWPTSLFAYFSSPGAAKL
jgi:hypothetical protein